MDWYYIAGRGAHGDQFIRASRTNCQPAESSGMSGEGANPQEQVPCPKCGKRVQRRYLRKHERSQHQGVRRRRHASPYCTAEICKTYSTFQDWKNHLHATHGQCLEDDDPLDQEEYASGQEQPEESPDQQELGPVVSGDRMTLVGPVASPVTSLPHTPGRDIVIAGNTEESSRTREGRLAAATLEQEIGRRSVAEAIRPIRERAVTSSSSAERAERAESASPSLGRGTQPPHPCGPRVAGFRQRASQQGRGRPESWQNLPPAAEVSVDAQTPERRVPQGNRAEAGASRVQPKPSRRTGAATAHAHQRSRD